jgi:iron(III) transport system permease protein
MERIKTGVGLLVIRAPLDTQFLLCSLMLAFAAFVILYPLLLILINSFQISRPGQPIVYGLDGWQAAFDSPTILRSVVNTLNLTWWRQLIGLPVGLLFVWLIARTDLPGRYWLEFLFWVAFFLPTLTVVQGYIMMFDPEYGIVNQLLAKLPFFGPGTFNIFSFWGIVFAHLATHTIATKVLLLTPAFRNMDAAMEESAQLCGSGRLGTLCRVTVPLMAPAVLVVVLTSTIRALETFEVEMVLGAPKNIYVYSMQIYYAVHSEPPGFGPATALSVMILLLMVPLVIWQQLATRKRYVTLTGQYRANIIPLGFWRWPAFFLVGGVAVFTTIIPVLLLITGTFMKLWGFFDVPEPWTTQHWKTVLGDPVFIRSVANTVIISISTALLGAVLSLIIAYIVVRTQFMARPLLDFLSWLPYALPGVILGLGYLWLFLGTPVLRELYGSAVLLVLALTVSDMTTKIQIIKTNLLQVGAELEEASRVTGTSWFYCFRTIIFPLVAQATLVAAILGFIHAARNVPIVALLASATSRPLSMLQLDFLTEGRYEPAAVVGTILVLLTVGVALLLRIFGLRIGPRQNE